MNKIRATAIIDFYRGLSASSVVSAYQVYQVVKYVQQIVMSIVLVKSGIRQADIGFFEIWLFLIAMLSQFWIAGFKDAMVSKYHQLDAGSQKSWLLSGIFSHLLAGTFFAVIFWFVWPFILDGKPDNTSDQLKYTGMFFLVFHALSQLPENIMLVRKQSRILMQYTVFSIILYVLLFVLYFCFFPRLSFMISGLLVAAMLKSSVLYFLADDWGWITFEQVRTFARYSIPFILISVLGYGMEMADGFLVVHFFDESVFPVYRYGAREIPLSSLLMNSLSVALIPMMADETNITALHSRVQKYMHVLFPLSILLVWISQPVYVFFYNASYSESAFIFNLYVLVIGSRLLLPHSILMARGHQRWVLISSACELAINILLSLWWVTLWGMYGLILATVVAYYVQKAVMLYALKKNCNLNISDIIPVKAWMVYHVLLFVSVYVNYLWLHV